MSAVCMLAVVSFFCFCLQFSVGAVSVFAMIIDVLISFHMFLFISVDCARSLVSFGA